MTYKIDAKLIKVLLQNKYRYKDGALVASEASISGTNNIADILVYQLKDCSFFEIEIKISKSDMLADLLKGKHKLYKDVNFKYTPNKFYYAVPSKLVAICIQFISDNNLPYGVIEIVTEGINSSAFSFKKMVRHSFKYSKVIKVVKRPKSLSSHKITSYQRDTFLMRLGSEVATTSRKLLEINTKLT